MGIMCVMNCMLGVIGFVPFGLVSFAQGARGWVNLETSWTCPTLCLEVKPPFGPSSFASWGCAWRAVFCAGGRRLAGAHRGY